MLNGYHHFKKPPYLILIVIFTGNIVTNIIYNTMDAANFPPRIALKTTF